MFVKAINFTIFVYNGKHKQVAVFPAPCHTLCVLASVHSANTIWSEFSNREKFQSVILGTNVMKQMVLLSCRQPRRNPLLTHFCSRPLVLRKQGIWCW